VLISTTIFHIDLLLFSKLIASQPLAVITYVPFLYRVAMAVILCCCIVLSQLLLATLFNSVRLHPNSAQPMKLLHTMKCACCGVDMLPDKELENTIIYKCKECGLTDSRLKDIG
jgi:hypothetical protein